MSEVKHWFNAWRVVGFVMLFLAGVLVGVGVGWVISNTVRGTTSLDAAKLKNTVYAGPRADNSGEEAAYATEKIEMALHAIRQEINGKPFIVCASYSKRNQWIMVYWIGNEARQYTFEVLNPKHDVVTTGVVSDDDHRSNLEASKTSALFSAKLPTSGWYDGGSLNFTIRIKGKGDEAPIGIINDESVERID